jgi:tetratricopeptide (TPR) repeat protein
MNRIEQLKSFLQESPGDNFLTHALALEFIKAGDDQTGLSYFLLNLKNNAQYIPTYYHLGKLYERVGETQKAIEIYGQGMEIARAAGDNHALSELRSVYEELIW